MMTIWGKFEDTTVVINRLVKVTNAIGLVIVSLQGTCKIFMQGGFVLLSDNESLLNLLIRKYSMFRGGKQPLNKRNVCYTY